MEDFVVTSLEVCQGTRSWIHGYEMVEGTKKSIDGRRRELSQPLHDHHLAVLDTDGGGENAAFQKLWVFL